MKTEAHDTEFSKCRRGNENGMLITAAALALAASGAVHDGECGDAIRPLPKPVHGAMSVEEAIAGRRSVRSFSPQPLSDSAIGALLFAAQGITDAVTGFRAAPSAGATYPLEIYLLTQLGVEHYLPRQHALERVHAGDVRPRLARACLGQEFIAQSPAIIVMTAVHERTRRRYGERALRYVAMEAGHAAQNIHLQAVALGLGSVPIGAFDDGAVERIIGCGRGEQALYVIAVGRPLQTIR